MLKTIVTLIGDLLASVEYHDPLYLPAGPGSIEMTVRKAFTSVQLRAAILEENHHPLPDSGAQLPALRNGQGCGWPRCPGHEVGLIGALLYAPHWTSTWKPWPGMPTRSSARCSELRGDKAEKRRWQAKLLGRPSNNLLWRKHEEPSRVQ
jgi:hypothetical protein